MSWTCSLQLWCLLGLMHQGWEALKSQRSLLYERMSISFGRRDVQTPVKLIAAAGRLTVEWHEAFGIGVAKFQKWDEANSQLSQKYQVQLTIIPVSFYYLRNEWRDSSLNTFSVKDDAIGIIFLDYERHCECDKKSYLSFKEGMNDVQSIWWVATMENKENRILSLTKHSSMWVVFSKIRLQWRNSWEQRRRNISREIMQI